MVWFRVDDTFAHHGKVIAAGNAAVGLWTRAGAWSMQQLTDGFVPDHVVRTLGSVSEAKRLVNVGLWLREDGGYQFHQWEGRQPSREKVESDRHAATERQRKARESAKSRRESQRDMGVSHGPPDPTRPDPTIKREDPDGSSSPEIAPTDPPQTTIALFEAPRPDVDRICNHLVARLRDNGVNRTVTAKWRDSARLMLDRDGRSEEDVHAAIDWSQADEFWRGNVLSLPKLREKYDQLRLQASRSPRSASGDRNQQQRDLLARALERAEAKERNGA